METWLWTIGAVMLVSAVSLVGVLSLLFAWERLNRMMVLLVSLAAGTLLGDAYFHLIPEAFETNGITASTYVLSGILIFFVLEKFIHWRHCHRTPSDEHPHSFSYVILVGDALHNFIDGLVIAASFLAGIEIGIATTIAVILHEIPQEIGDFGSPIYDGFSKGKALFYNFITALTALFGAILVLTISRGTEGLTEFLVPFAAGGFIYIAASDIIPELHKTTKVRDSIGQLVFLLFGIGAMFLLLFLE